MSEEELLVDRDEYLANGVHIGNRGKHKDMEPYIYHVKKNQLAVLDINKTDEQIRQVGEYLADYNPEEILVVGSKDAAQKVVKTFSKAVGTDLIAGRFMPGTLTNPQSDNFTEPEVVLVTDPEEDRQAITEAADVHVPVVAIADSDNNLDDVDYVIPANNKAENSIGMVLYLLAEQIAENRDEDFAYQMGDFVEKQEEDEEE